MTTGPLGGMLGRLRAAFAAADSPDAALLRRFVQYHDQAAFTALVERHGPMVLGVCRRVLHGRHDAEDAFQATFLVLARKAAALGPGVPLGPWLHGVAQRTALKARTTAARRRRHERQAAVMTLRDRPADAALWRELRPVLDAEIARLPAAYRAVVVLCLLEGRTHAAAAQALGWPVGTVAGRLARARGQLRQRLARRGVVLTAAGLAALLAPARLAAAVPPPLAELTATAAVRVAAGQALGAVAAEPVVRLTKGVLRQMFITPLVKLATAAAALVAATVAAVGLLPPNTQAPAAVPAVAPLVGQKPAAAKGADDLDKIQGLWTLTGGSHAGKDAPAEMIGGLKLIFKGEEITIQGPEAKRGTFKLNPKVDPKAIDVTVDGMTGQGIYRLDGDKLWICLNEPRGGGQGDRPTKFATDAATPPNVMFLMFQRGDVKPPPGAPPAGETAALMRSENNLKQIGIGMHVYHDRERAFPRHAILSKDGKPLLSWRVAILPYLDQDALYRAFHLDEPWDSEHNKKLLAQMPRTYAATHNPPKEPGHTYYRGFVGKDTVFDPAGPVKLFGITDGSSNTLMVVEADEATPWTKPDDLPYEANKPLPKLGGRYQKGFPVLTADGAVHVVKPKFNEQVFRLLITRSDGQVVDWDALNK